MNKPYFLLPLMGLAALLACLFTYSLTRSGEAPEGPRASKDTGEGKAWRRVSPSAVPTSLPSSSPILSGKPEPSPAVQPGLVIQEKTGGGHGTLGYLRDIPAHSGKAGRMEVIRRTAEHLGVREESQADFEKAAGLALSDMEEASRLRREEARVLGLLGPGSRKAVPNDASRQLQERYAARRSAALGPLEPYLAGSPVAQEFRTNFDAWVATVWMKGRENQ